MSDDLSRVGELVHSTECLCHLNLDATAVLSDDELSQFLKEVLTRALSESGAVSGSVFLLDPCTQRWKQQIRIVHGQELPLDRPEHAASNQLGTPLWEILGERKEVLWLDLRTTRPQRLSRLSCFSHAI